MLASVSPRATSWAAPLALFVLFSAIYAATAGERLFRPSANNHHVQQAAAWLRAELDLGSRAPGTNDWACFDTLELGACPSGRYSFEDAEPGRYRWFVSFPPLPALLLLPWVAIFGVQVWDVLFWVLFAGLGPALLFVLLEQLRTSGRTERSRGDNLLLTLLFGVGSVYYFVAVQGSVWYAAHVVAIPLIVLYLLYGFDARRPVLAGLALGLAFLARPATLLLAPFFLLQSRDEPRRMLRFAVPLVALVLLAMAYNYARFEDPLEFGHRFLQIRWRPRIERWGLFSYHYLGRNLAVFLASLPWLLEAGPYVRISRHGLALWFTTPNLLWTLWPQRSDSTTHALWLAIVPTMLCTLLYQNSGWVQFGYRFSLDYLPLLFVLLALSGRSFGRLFWVCALFSIAINTFGALTFDRHPQFYDDDRSQQRIFQPD